MQSVTHVWFGAAAVKAWPSKAPARVPSLAGIVVRTPWSRRAPGKPRPRVAGPPTLQMLNEPDCGAPGRSSRGASNDPSAASMRWPGQSALQAQSRTTSMTWASVRLLAETRSDKAVGLLSEPVGTRGDPPTCNRRTEQVDVTVYPSTR